MPMKIETKTYVYSTFHICWGAQAGLYYHDGIHKHDLQEKLFGVFPHMLARRSSMFMRGFDDTFMVPHSRHTTIRREEVLACGKLKILASSPKVGIYALSTEGGRQIFKTARQIHLDERLLHAALPATIVPILRQGQHLRQQPLGFQGQLLVSQMVV